jgi:protein phosphatase 1 regulatory subunit 10
LCFSSCDNAAIKDMSANIERGWRRILSEADGLPPTNTKQPNNNMVEGESRQFVPLHRTLFLTVLSHLGTLADIKPKKRKLNDAPLKAPPPMKKPAVGTTSSSKPVVVKKETKPVLLTAVKDAKSDFSFFSAPKPKPKLPSFKKAPPPPAGTAVKREPGANGAGVAQPSSIDPFQEALKSMKARKDSPVVSTPPSTTTPPLVLQHTQTGVTKNGKRKKSVSWAPEDKLESIRFIEKAIYDDDPVDVSYISFSFVRCVCYLTVSFFLFLLPPHQKTSCFCVLLLFSLE